MRNRLTKEEVLSIKEMRKKGRSNSEIADRLDVSPRAVAYWIKRLRDEGYEIPIMNKGGGRAIILK